MHAQSSSIKQYNGINTNLKKIPKIRSSNRWYKDPERRKAVYVLCGSLLCVLIIIAAIFVPIALVIVLSATTTAITSTLTSTSGTVTTGANTTLVTASAMNLTHSTATTASATTTTVCPNMTCTFSATASPMTSTYGVEHLDINCTQTLSVMNITIAVQRTVNASYANQYETFWNLTTSQTYVQTSSQIIYTWTLLNGQIIDAAGFPYFVEGQYFLDNTNQTTSLDIYSASFLSICGHAISQSGTF